MRWNTQVTGTSTHLAISKFRESVDDDTKDDVQADGCNEDEEGEVIDDEESELQERVLGLVTC